MHKLIKQTENSWKDLLKPREGINRLGSGFFSVVLAPLMIAAPENLNFTSCRLTHHRVFTPAMQQTVGPTLFWKP